MALIESDLKVYLHFDIDNDRFRIQDDTDYADEGMSLEDIAGVYKITDPNGNILHEGIDYNNPDVDPYLSVYSAYQSFTLVEGIYTLVYNVYYDTSVDVIYTKTFTFTYNADDIPSILVGIESDVALSIIESTDETTYVPLSTRTSSLVLNTRTHTLTWPTGTISTETSTSVDSISLTELWTGEYLGEIVSSITITNTDDVILHITISNTAEPESHFVWSSDGFYAVRVALDTFYARWTTAQTSNPKKAREYSEIWNQINSNAAMYNAHKQNGDVENSGIYLNNIKELLAAQSIDTVIDPSISVPVSQTLPGYATQWLSGSGVPSASLGRNGDYYFQTDDNNTYKKVSGAWGIPIANIGGLGVGVNPGTIIIPKDKDDVYDYTGATSQIYISIGGIDATPDFTYVKGTESNVTASVSATGEVTITELTASYGAVQITCSKTGVDDIIVDVIVKEIAEGYDSVTTYCSVPSVAIPTDANGNNQVYPISEPQIYVIEGNEDVTSAWTIAIFGTSEGDVVASIVDHDKLAISSLTVDEDIITISCAKSGYDTLYVKVLVYKAKAGQAVVDATSVDNSTIEFDAGTSKIRVKDLGITTAKIAELGVTTGKIAALGVTTEKIANLGVTTAKIAAEAITYDKLDANIVDNETIEIDTDGSVLSSALRVKDLGVVTAKIAEKAVTRAKISDVFTNYVGTIANNDATPDVTGKNVWVYNGTANSVTVTDLDSPIAGAIYTIIGNSDVYIISIANGGNFRLVGDWRGSLNKAITLLCVADNDYVEISRSLEVLQRIIPIGVWDMDASPTVDVNISAYGITYANIRDIRAYIFSDDSTLVSKPLHSVSSLSILNGGVSGIDTGVVTLYRLDGCAFDSTSYNSTGFSRGYIIVDYV